MRFPATTMPILAALLMIGSTSASVAPAAHAPDQPVKVVATFSVLGDLVQNVGGARIELVTIVPPGGDAHAFDPNPEQVASIADADVIFENGAGFEVWLDDMVAASGSSAARVVTSDGVALRSIDDDVVGEEVDPGNIDPHVWHDVANAIVMVENVRDGLVAADTDNTATYKANANAYLAQLKDLDTFVRGEVAKLPEDRRKLVTTHDTFGYFARAYGFEISGSALSSVSTEAADPSAQDIATLVEEIEATGVPAIFAENVSNPDLMQSIADEAGVELAPTLYTDALGEAGTPGDTYINMIRYNATTIVTALSA